MGTAEAKAQGCDSEWRALPPCFSWGTLSCPSGPIPPQEALITPSRCPMASVSLSEISGFHLPFPWDCGQGLRPSFTDSSHSS